MVCVSEHKSVQFPGGKRFLLCNLLKNSKFINDPWFLHFFHKAGVLFYFIVLYILVHDFICFLMS